MKQMNLDIVKSRKDAEQQLIESVPVSIVLECFKPKQLPIPIYSISADTSDREDMST